MKRLFRLFVFLTVAAMVCSAFAGCTSSTAPVTTTQQATAQASESVAPTTAAATTALASEPSDPYAEKISFSMISNNPVGSMQSQDTMMQKQVEKKFNVAITVEQIDMFNDDQWNLFWASGQTCDLTMDLSDRHFKLQEQGLIREIPSDMLFQLLPNWMKNVEAYCPKDIYTKVCTIGGKWYLIPYANFVDAQPWIVSVRTDWMKNVGTTKMPTTLDEYHDLLYKFVHNDPDQDGKDDTTGLSPIGLYFRDKYYIWKAFDILPNSYFFNKDNQMVYTSATENFKELCKTLSQWYKEGIIDPEFLTDDRTAVRKKWAEGKFGVYSDTDWWWDQSLATNMVSFLKAGQPNATLDFMLPPETLPQFAGTGGGFDASYIKVTDSAWMYGAKTSDAVIERTMRMMETLVDDFDWYVTVNFGIKDQTYTIDSNGTYNLTPDMTDEAMGKNGVGLYFGACCYSYDFFKKTKGNIPMNVFEACQKITPMLHNNGVIFSPESKNKYVDQFTAVTDLTTAFYANAITGKIDVDTAWDSYMNDLKKAGLDSILALTPDQA